MKKKYLKYISMTLVLFSILYSIIWWSIANKIKENNFLINNVLFSKEKLIYNPILIKGYPFKFVITLPKHNININPKTKFFFNNLKISHSIFNYKDISVESSKLIIHTFVNNLPVILNSDDYRSHISIDQKKNIYLIDHYISYPDIIIKFAEKNINFQIKKINIKISTINNDLNLKINLIDLAIPSHPIENNQINIDIGLNNIDILKFSESYLSSWRENGIIQINNLQIKKNKMNFSLRGSINIDKDFYVNGKIYFTSHNPMVLIDYLYKRKIINLIQYKAIKLIFNISPNSLKEKIDIPIYLKQKNIFIGPVFIEEQKSVNKFLF